MHPVILLADRSLRQRLRWRLIDLRAVALLCRLTLLFEFSAVGLLFRGLLGQERRIAGVLRWLRADLRALQVFADGHADGLEIVLLRVLGRGALLGRLDVLLVEVSRGCLARNVGVLESRFG